MVTVRDLANFPMAGAIVKVDFSPASDVAFCSSQPDAALTVDCGGRWVSKATDAAGQARFDLVGAGTGTYSQWSRGCVVDLYAGSTLLGRSEVRAFDLDGSGDVGGGDLGTWLTNFIRLDQPAPLGIPNGSNICDFDFDSYIGAIDLSRWLTAFPTSGSSVGSLCR